MNHSIFRYGYICKFGLLRRATSRKSQERFQKYSRRSLVRIQRCNNFRICCIKGDLVFPRKFTMEWRIKYAAFKFKRILNIYLQVGRRYHDYSGLWGHGTKDIRWPYSGFSLCTLRCACDCITCARYRVELQYVLQSYTGTDISLVIGTEASKTDYIQKGSYS